MMDGPYRATKLWNEMLHTFKHGMPLRRHRRHMKVYDNCFSGAEAIQWLQIALKDNPNIKPGVSKTQVRQLLTKFMKAGIFCSVCTSNSSDAQEFKENEIYQFSSHNSGFNLMSTNEPTRVPVKIFEIGLEDSRKANVDKKKNILPSSNIPAFLRNPRIPFENCSHKDYNTEMQPGLRRKESFSCTEKPGNVLKGGVNTAQKENTVFSSQAYDSTRSVPIPPKKPQRRLESCTGLVNPCISNRYDANQNLNLEQKYPQHEARSFPRNSMNSCTHFDRHAHVKSYPSSTHRSPPYESACHVVYNNKKLNAPVSYQEENSDLCKLHYKTVNSDTVCMRKTKTVGHNENYQQFPLYTQPGSAHNVFEMEHRLTYPSAPLKPLHSNVISMHDVRGNYGSNSCTNYRRDPAGKIMSDANSQFSPSEGSRYDTAKYYMEEKCILNDGYKKLTDMPYGSIAPPELVSNVVSSSETEIRDAWKMIFILRLETVLAGMEEITALLPSNIRIDWLIRNVQEHADTVPRSSSVESGLDEWPEDIINNYREQLAGIKEPLITTDLYSLLTEAYLYVEHINNASTQFMCKSREALLASRSVENLVLGMASPCAQDLKNSQYAANKNAAAGSAVYCYETAFASDTPITRIVPQSSLKNVYFSRQNMYSRSFRSSRERLPLEDQVRIQDKNVNSFGTETYPSRTVWRSKSSQDVKETVSNNNTNKSAKEKSHNRSGRRWRMTRKLSETSQKSSGLQHCRNKSGGYVNPALSQSLEDLSSQKFASEELDYVAALETLQALMRHTHMTMNDKNDRGGLQESSCDLSSESGSYYTAASTPERQKYSNVSLTKEHEQSKWKQPALGLGISVFQLLLLLISPGRRCLLKRLLRCLHHLPTAINTEEAMQVIQSMTPNVLDNEQENDKSLAFRVVRFLVTFYKEVFEIPADLQGSVFRHLNQGIQAQKVTYCEQVTSKQFQEQGLSGSQKALSELLEQILSDPRMGEKEKKRRLKLFRERYPNIYKQHFPDLDGDQANSEKSRGILQLPSLGKLKNIRI